MATSARLTILLALAALCAPIRGAPASFQMQNGLDAQKLNAQFATMNAGDVCTNGQQACVNNAFAQCVQGAWELTFCNSGEICVALPLVAKAGTSIACDTEADAIARMQSAGVDASITGNGSTPSSTPSLSAAVSVSSSVATTPTPSPTDDPSDDCEHDDDEDDQSSVSPTIITLSASPSPSLILLNKRERPNLPVRDSQSPKPTGHISQEFDNRAFELVKRQLFSTFPISSSSSSSVLSGSATPVVSASATPTPSSSGAVEVVTVTVFSVVVVTATPTPSLASSVASSASVDSSSVFSVPSASALPPLFSSASSPAFTQLSSSFVPLVSATTSPSVIFLTPSPNAAASPIITTIPGAPSVAPSASIGVISPSVSSTLVFFSATTIDLNTPASVVASSTGFPVLSTPTLASSSSASVPSIITL